mgnify:CR=1 FL=1
MPRITLRELLWRQKRSIRSDLLKVSSFLNFKEGEQLVVTYTSAMDKMKVFSAFMREGLESGDAVWYTYPDEESETVKAKLEEYGIDVKEYEKNGALHMTSLTEEFMSNGKLDYNKAVSDGVNWWGETKRKGCKHARSIQDVGDFSFVNGQWRKWITDYWLDPRWDDPNVSEWVVSKEPVGSVYIPFVMSVTAINVERMVEKKIDEILEAFGRTTTGLRKFFIDLLKYEDSFSRSMGLNHEGLVGRKILFEFDSTSDYEKVVDNLVKESVANVEPIFVFTLRTSPIRTHLGEQPAVKFFLTSTSTSTLESPSENEVVLPARSTPLILDAINKVLETHADTNVCFVFDILSELLSTMGLERTFIFLRHALDMLHSKKVTGLFLFNTSAQRAKVISQIRGLFSNQLTYDKYGLKVIKIFPRFKINPTK